MFEPSLIALENDLFCHPNKSLILAANYLMMTVTRDLLPDWVEILANGNPNCWSDVIDVARADIAANKKLADEATPKKQTPWWKPQRGQSFVETAIGLGVLALLILVGWTALMSSDAGQSMTAWAAGAMSDMTASISMDQSHAIDRHGIAVVTSADQCFKKYGVVQTWTNPTTGYRANICYEGANFFVQIIKKVGDQWQEVTKFKRDCPDGLGSMGRYLKEAGYVR